MLNVMEEYEEYQEEKFNEDFIFLKKNDPILKHFDNIASTLEVIDGITYLGSSIETDELKLNYETVPKKKKRTKKEKEFDFSRKWVSVEESRMNLVTLKWKVVKEDRNYQNKDKVDEDGFRRGEVELKILFPKLMRDFYFVINGRKSFPIFQIIDTGTYVTKLGALTLKSILMPIVLRPKYKEYETLGGDKYKGKIFILDLFRHKVNVMQYFFAKFGGLEPALGYLLNHHEDLNKYGDYTNYLEIIYDKVNKTEVEDDIKNLYFKINTTLHIKVNKKIYEEVSFLRDIVTSTISNLMNKKIRLKDPDYWLKSLGRVFSRSANAQKNKAEMILISLERLMDNGTKSNLRYKEEDKEDVYAVIRWMMMRSERLAVMDNMSLYNKRLRFNEYLINPLLMRFSNNTYRGLNTRSMTFNKIMDLFSNIDSYFLVRNIRNSDLLRLDGTVNTIDLFSSGLKFSFKGPQSFAQNTYTVENKYRGLHGSYIGRLGLVSSSNGDPGMTGCFTPFNAMDEKSPFHFIDEDTYRGQFE